MFIVAYSQIFLAMAPPICTIFCSFRRQKQHYSYMPPPIIMLLSSLSYHISDTKVQICYLQLLLHYQGCATCAYTSLSRNAIFKSQSCVIMENSQRLLSTKKKMENIKDGSYWAIMRCFVITTNISNKSNTSKCQRFHLYPKAPINLIYIYIYIL